ncbi:uncharacterized protein [Miscanthus floridulus]|uniref:uncharacterized protein isoform X4 n=1 Tax=Miscanthus floridulus TaxID=154761 RepID=UPI003458456D
MAGAATPRSSSPAAFSGVTCGAARLASLNNTHLNKTHTITWEEFKKKQDVRPHFICRDGGMRLRLWSVATVVWEARAQGGDGEGAPARQKSSDDEGSAARHKSSDGEGNASMHAWTYQI